MSQEMTLNVNDRIHRIQVDPDTPLLYVLRNDLDLKGAKYACGLGQCGACDVIVDGRVVAACRISVRAVQGSRITTLEGIGTAEDLHPLQRAFMDEQAVQCGYCVPGVIMAAKALLDRNPHPSDEEIKAKLANNLCRCGIYDRMLRAVKRAAGLPVDPSARQEIVNRETYESKATRSSAQTQATNTSLEYIQDIDSWIRIDPNETVTVFTGKVELGQDIRTSVAMLAAEELDVSLHRLRVVMADTAQTPNEAYTWSSMSLETSGNAVRMAAAEARQLLLVAAREKLQVPLEGLTVVDGTITDPASGRQATYWELFGGKRFDSKAMGIGRPKPPESYGIVGHSVERLDLLEKVTGRLRFVQDLDLPDMVHGRVVRPPNDGGRLVGVDEAAVIRMPGVIKVLCNGSFLAVVAEREEQAVEASKVLEKSAAWESDRRLPTHEQLFEHMLNQPDQVFLVENGTPVDDPIPPIETPSDAAHTVSATYYRPYHMHAAIGPSAAVAQLADGMLTVWSHTQGPYPLRAAIAEILGMAQETIRVVHVDGPGCFGHNGADDAALDAALLAKALPGRPVSVKWTRRDENVFEPYGPAAIVKIKASLDKDDEVSDWNHDVWGYSHMGHAQTTKEQSDLLGSWYLDPPFQRPRPFPFKFFNVGIHRNADPIYTFSRRRIVKRFLPDSPLRISNLRGLGSYTNIFAIESFMDELAHAAGIDPIEFRLRHLADTRARDVLEAVLEIGGWESGRTDVGDKRGWGVALSRYKNLQCYTAAFVVVQVDKAEGRIRLERAVLAADVGQIVNPEAVSSQLEGAFVQSASWTLKEQVAFDTQGVTSVDWRSYPIARFPDAPTIETVLVDRPGSPYLGLGEGVMGPAPAAIANAVFRAAGIRLRRIPFTPERVKAATE
ncbi:MAG: molybdopterin-dependent oxidoreductase [Proteobacteria bacterium]|nr:molybdopterin-dependent oxidoreductase [Pseudomonadota bacterium]